MTVRTKGKFRHLSYVDRIRIEAYRKAGKSVAYIAAETGFSVSTIYRELKRGYYERMESDWRVSAAYSADIAQKDYDYKATAKGAQLKIGTDHELANYIERKIIENRYSPAAVLGEIQEKGLCFQTRICVRTLYNYIDKQIFLLLTNKNLLYKGNRKRPYRKVQPVRAKKPLCASIEDRPENADLRREFGHWEMDTVIGKAKGSGQVLLVLTERLTRQEIILKLKHKTFADVVTALNRLERKYGRRFPELFKTISVDNDSEFMDVAGMERSCRTKKPRTKVYYCHPYSSWERGSNENANAIIRRFIPKGTPIESYSAKEVQLPLWAPGRDDDFDTEVSRLSSLLFLLENVAKNGLNNTFMKSAAAGWGHSRSVAALFCVLSR